MNPELANRLRRFGETVDQAAIAAQDERTAARGAAGDPHVAGDGTDVLPTVVPIIAARSTRRYRAITAAAAAIVVVAGALITARIAGDSDPRPTSSTDVSVNTTARSSTTTEPPPTTTTVSVIPPPSSVAATSSTTTSTTTTDPSASSTSGGAPVTSAGPCPNGYDPYPQAYPIRLCHEGPAVSLIQTRTGAPADGAFGPATRQSVRVFQEQNGLNADGLVGPLTWAAMFPDGAPGTDADGDGTVEPWEVG